MKYPTRTPRVINPVYVGKFVDHESVLQDDGRIAVFKWSYEDGKTWEFSSWRDKHGFHIYETEEEQFGEHAQTLIASEKDLLSEEIPPYEALNTGEKLHAYRYGGILSKRMGWYITSEAEPNRVLRSKQRAMS